VRYSANLRLDGTLTDERRMCGEGTRPPQWIPLGPGPTVDVLVQWRPGAVTVSTPAGRWTATQGARGPGFGWWTEGIPKGGIGWTYRDAWTLQAHGGAAQLVSWQAEGDQPPMQVCSGWP